ncbi:MAG: PAS domain-containing sensor histidine kinase [Candidatus Thermoplasmatota archaeon]|jgi:PAS domain S-box-containing protein
MGPPVPALPPELGEFTVRALLESAPDALVIVDERGIIVLANGQAGTLFGYPQQELVGQPVEMLVPLGARAGHPAHRAAFMASPRTRPMGAALDLHARRKDGTEIPVEISLSPLETTRGRLVSASIRDVTGRRKAEQKFRALLESAPDAIVIVDATGAIVLTNAQAERLFGYTRTELLSSNVDALVPDLVRSGHAAHRARFMADPKARSMGAALDLRARRKDGSEIPVEISLSPLETEEGLLVSAAIRDVSERRRAQEGLSRLAAIVAASADGILTKTLEGIITSWNPSCERLFGYSAAEILGQSVTVLYPPGAEEEERAILDRTGQGEAVAVRETRRIRKDGSQLWVSVSVAPQRDASGRIIGATAIKRDITDIRRAQDRFRGLLEAAPDAMVIVDSKGKIVLVNAQAERLFGYTRAEMTGSSVDRLVPDAVRPKHAGHRERFMAEPKARPMGAALDLRARRKDGSEIPVEISLSPLETEGERLVMAAVRDITERRRMEKERQEGRDRQRELEHLREVDQFKTTFLNTAAHELRTPLLPIKAQFHLLKRRLAESPDPETKVNVQILDRNIVRLASLVEDLLDAARYQAGRVVLQVEDSDLFLLLDEAVASFRQVAKDRSLTLELRKSGPGRLRLDPRRVTQVLYNLLSNAIKFTPDGGKIAVDCAVDRIEATVRVIDSGLGLSTSDIRGLFQPFAQLQESVVPGQRGSGLGLYISRGFVEAHGGRIWAESPGTGKGSTFSFTIPARPETAGPTTGSSPATA